MKTITTLIAAAGLALATTGATFAGNAAQPVTTKSTQDSGPGADSLGALGPAGAAGIIGAIVLVAIIANSGGDDPATTTTSTAASDARLKTDIARVGETAGGLPLYQFRYIGEPTVYQGVMAQDVLCHRPDAISVMENGYMAVDYGKLGLEMTVVD